MPTGKKFGTHVVLQIWTITYFTSVLHDKMPFGKLKDLTLIILNFA
jgi:hypothetical protein